MDKPIRKGVRTYLINENKVVVTKYIKGNQIGYYDIPGGKIEENESNAMAAIREFKEETGIDIYNPKYVGNLVVECPDMIFDFDIFTTNDYEGTPQKFENNDSMWMDIDSLLKEDKIFKNIKLLSEEYRENLTSNNNFKIKFILDKDNNIIDKITK